MFQKLIATTTLGKLVGIGEFFDQSTEAKPGRYNVYKVLREEDDYECAILFVHETGNQDVNVLLPTLDAKDSIGIDGGTYGILTMKNENDTMHGTNNRFDEWCEYNFSDETNLTDGYVIGTNYGDGIFTLYMNDDHSAFLLDDEDIYLQSLLADCEKFEADDLSYFGFYQESSDVPVLSVGYVAPQGDSEYELVEKRIEAPHGVRKIDAVVNFIKSLLN